MWAVNALGWWGVIVNVIKPTLLCKFSQNLTAKDYEKQHKVADWGKKQGGGGEVDMHRK